MANIFDSVTRKLLLPDTVAELQQRAYDIARRDIAPLAQHTDTAGAWPEHAFKALAAGALMGILAPRDCGGKGEGMLALAAVTGYR